MNQHSRGYKILSKVKISKEDETSDENEELSTAIQNLQKECLQAQEVLEENLDYNMIFCDEEFAADLIADSSVKSNEDLEALINIDSLAPIPDERQVCDDDQNDSNKNDQEQDNTSLCSEENGDEEWVDDDSRNTSSSEETTDAEDESQNENENPNIMEEDIIENNNTDSRNKKRKRKKNRLSNSKEWEYNTHKKKREEGSAYLGRKENKFSVQKAEKTIKNRCLCKENESRKKVAIKCFKIDEEERKKIFRQYWRSSWEGKKAYVRGRAIALEVKRTRNRKVENQSRRNSSYAFYLDKKNQRVRVCKTMFCNTLGMSMRTITDWLNKSQISPQSKTGNNHEVTEQELNDKDLRNLGKKKSVETFLKSLPKLESHYCRKSTTKLYLEPCWKSKSELYRLYTDSWCKERNIQGASQTMFKYIFEEMNLSLFSPKKDECDTCVGYRTQNISEEKYNAHVEKKNEARDEKAKDKESPNCVFTMDLQSVLLCPQSNVSALYYKTKLIVHNFTIFDLHSKNGYCFMWHEGEGELKSNCFASIICYFLSTMVLPNISRENSPCIILYSDGCSAQNRNSTLSNALINFAIENNVCVIQKYLEKGHTQMECDSMHSTIERKIKGRVINVPADYVYCAKTARQQPHPYVVEYLHHKFFKNFCNVNLLNSIRPGFKVGDPTVQDLRALKYNPDGSIQYKLRHTDDFQVLPVRLNKKYSMTPFQNLPDLYHDRLKIKLEKYEHLQSLKNTMEKDYHGFYDALLHA